MKFNLRRFAKATVGPALGLLGAVAQYVVTGHIDQHSLIYFGGGLIGGIVTYLVPNAAPEVQALESPYHAPLSALAPQAELTPSPTQTAPAPLPPSAA